MPNALELRGQRFGRLIALQPTCKRISGSIVWLCQCDCGKQVEVKCICLSTQGTTSCGCYARERRLLANVKHGMTDSREYTSWGKMLDRCRNKKSKSYYNYGGRSLIVCARWHDFRNFYADIGPRPLNTSLDRIDNDLGYFPENCRWADRATQRKNQRKLPTWAMIHALQNSTPEYGLSGC